LDDVKRAGAIVTDLHKRRYTFQIEKNEYAGEFTVKYPSLLDRMKIGALRAKYLGDAAGNVDIVTDNIVYMFATLETVAVKKPGWFDLDSMDDYSVLEAVFDQYTNWANTFRVGSEPDTDAENSRTGANEETVEGNETVSDTY